MRSKLLMSCLAWLCVATACGEVSEGSATEAPSTGESTQAVLYPPPVPASGNILDSTTYMGPLALPGSVQTQFTMNPQYFSFSFQAQAGAQVKLEVTHLGSSMYLDTGLFVYGPKQANGSYGTLALAQDDDAGYGQLSKIAALALTQGGEYLAVVSTGTGAGKQFRLQLDCLNGLCPPSPAPSSYTLALNPLPYPPGVQAIMDFAYDACEGACTGWLRIYDFPWYFTGEPTLEMARRAVERQSYFDDFAYARGTTLPYAQWEPRIAPAYRDLHLEFLTTYWNGTETVTVAVYEGGSMYSNHDLYVVLFPQSHKVMVYEEDYYL
ncbi:hypothetical protein [Pyxidicoccus trucidator]|uniref:hypothetical protein n=1 Tax=Pyxidicoccus trucidator TaxID=2709662 RepID=UPI0013DB100A|nr:hypothetical protein [Pyxidicoccus trucidator]